MNNNLLITIAKYIDKFYIFKNILAAGFCLKFYQLRPLCTDHARIT